MDNSFSKIRILQIVRFYSLKKIKDYIDAGNIYPKHHLWCYDKLLDAGFIVGEVTFNKESFLNRFGKLFRIINLAQQLKAIRLLKEYDVVYSPWLTDVFFLVLLKYLRLIDIPIIGFSHSTFNYNKRNPVKKIFGKIRRHIFLSATNRILYFNKQTYERDLKYGNIPSRHGYIKSWGVDIDFFKEYVKNKNEKPDGNYIFSTGGTNRDFKLLTKIFLNCDYKLRIATKYSSDFLISSNENIVIDNSITPGFDSAEKLLPYYYNAKAFAIPLKNKLEMCTGLTVVFEAMAMGKPVITTKNDFYSIDVEEEGIGFSIADNDMEGWRRAIDYIYKYPENLKKMGDKGTDLCNRKYNYNIFCKEIIENINQLFKRDN